MWQAPSIFLMPAALLSTYSNGVATLNRNELTSKILTIGGFDSNHEVPPSYGYLSAVDKLNPESSNSQCARLPDFPVPMGGMTVENIDNDFIMACGGGQECDDGTKLCYGLNLSNLEEG